MSKEFGSYSRGYFHDQIETAAGDCLSGSHDLTRLVGGLLGALQPVAHAISGYEASDFGPEAPILAAMAALPDLREKLNVIARYLEPYSAVANAAVLDTLRKQMTP